MAAHDVSLAADITLVCGGSGSGKSTFVKRNATDADRIIVFDSDEEYASLPGFTRIAKAGDLIRYLQRAKKGRFAFVPRGTGSDELFDLWCKAAFAWGNCTVIAEELADVTSPGKAPDGWGQLVRRGRKRGLRIFGITQRPSESDKTIVGNASRIWCGSMTRADDRRYMAKEMDVSQELVNQLKPLDYVIFDKKDRSVTPGRLEF